LTLLVTLVKWFRLNKQLECAVYGRGDALRGDVVKGITPKTDWALFQNLLVVLDAGSLRAAALKSQRSLNTVRSRIAELERLTGLVLIDRHVQGARATDAAQPIIAIARAMEAVVGSSTMAN
jgi:Bacterial regulatory helix-turn-helix protein, lysR family